MLKRYLNNRLLILYITPILLGLLTVFSFQPFNISLINFLILPIFFFLQLILIRNLKVLLGKNHIKKIYLYLEHYLVSAFM